MEQLDPKHVKYLGIKGKEDMIKEVRHIDFSRIETLKNICFFLFGDQSWFVMVNIVKTDKK